MKLGRKHLFISLSTIVAVLAMLIGALYLFVYPKIKNISQYEPIIKKTVLEKTGLPVEIKNLNGGLGWDLSYNVTADKVVLKKNNGSDFVSGDTVKVKIFLPPLLFKKIQISRIEANNFYVDIKRLKSGEIDLIKLFKKSAKENFKVRFENSKIIANNYRINFQDLYVKPSPIIVFAGQKLYVENFTQSKFISFKSSGTYTMNGRTKPFDISLSSQIPFDKNHYHISGSTTKLYFQDFSQYLVRAIPTLKQIHGSNDIIFDIENSQKFYIKTNLNNFSFIHSKRGKIFEFSPKVFIDFSATKKNNSLKFNNFTAKSKDFSLKLEGSINDLNKKAKNLDLKLLVGKGSKVESLVKLFPNDLKVKDHIVRKLKDYKVKGNIETELVLKKSHKKPLLYGWIKYDTATLMDDYTSKPSFGYIKPEGEKLFIDSKVFVGKEKFVQVVGYTRPFYGKSGDLKVTTSKNLDLSLTHKKLLAIRDMVGFKITPVEDMKMSGKGDLNLSIKGKFNNSNIIGKMNLINAQLSYITLSKPVNHVFGSITFRGNKLTYDNLKGKVQGSTLEVNGYTTLKGYSDTDIYLPNADLAVTQDLINHSPLLEQTKKAIVIIQQPKGRGEIKVNLKGTQKNTFAKGQIKIKDGFVRLKEISAPAYHVNGIILFNSKEAEFKNITGTISQSPIILTGTIKNQIADLLIRSKKMNTLAVYQMINTSPSLKSVKKSLKDYSDPNGFMETKIYLKGNVNSKNLFQKGIFKVQKTRIKHVKLSEPITMTGGTFIVTPDKFSTTDLKAIAFGAKTTVSGSVTGLKSGREEDMVQNLTFHIYDLDVKNMPAVIKSNAIKPDAKVAFSYYKYKQGMIDAKVELLPKNQIVTMYFKNTSAVYIPTDAALTFKNGSITVDLKDMTFNNLNAMMNNSYVYLNGTIKNFAKQPVYDIFLNSYTDSNDFNTKIAPLLNLPIEAKGKIPFNVIFKGNSDQWKIKSQINLDKNSNIYYKGAELGEKAVRIISLDAQGNSNEINVNHLTISTPLSELPENIDKAVSFEDAQKLETLLEIKGKVKDFSEIYPKFDNFRISAFKPLNISLLNGFIKKSGKDEPFFTTGEFQGNLNIQGKTNSPRINGSFRLTDIIIPSLDTFVKYANVDFDDKLIIIGDSNIDIGGSILSVDAIMDNVLDSPMRIRRLEINSNSINIDKIINNLKSKKNEKDDDVNSFGAALPLVVVMDGSICSNELILNNLITNNFFAKFNFTPDWLLTVPEIGLDAAQGKAFGSIMFNFNSKELTGNIFARDMKANAAASTLLKLPNEVYGNLNGDINFSTKAEALSDFISNANGTIKFKIDNGRLIRLGSIEYFLRILNLVKGGLSRLNLNSIVDLFAPYRTGYFKELSGTIQIKNGILVTDNVVSQGDNLSLFISGTYNMANSQTDATILGKMPKKLSGTLGPIGELSIHSLIDLVPVLGYMPKGTQKPLIDIIPDIDKIPGLGLGGGSQRYFMVNLKGDLYGSDYVKDFKWIKVD